MKGRKKPVVDYDKKRKFMASLCLKCGGSGLDHDFELGGEQGKCVVCGGTGKKMEAEQCEIKL